MTVVRFTSWCVGLVGAGVLVAACGDDSTTERPESREPGATTTVVTDAPDGDQRFPDVLSVEVERDGDVYDFEVTVSSPYDTPDRYADGWRVTGVDGTVYGEHELGHDHANEQPFTRTQSGVAVPDRVDEVVVEGRDSRHGYGGRSVTVSLPDG